MKLYKDGMEIQADKEQLKLLLVDGWSQSKEEDVLNENTSEKITEDDDIKDIKLTSVIKPTKRVKKPKKISVKE
jgi:hypothetical protein